MKSTGIDKIGKERKEQIEKHGYTPEKDSQYKGRQLAEVAATLIHPTIGTPRKRLSLMPSDWNDEILLKMCKKEYEERLIIAGALIAAEIDRIQEIEKQII